MTTALERVRAGAQLLDAKTPTWFEHVDVDTLATRHMFLCVLGQTYGFYTNGRTELFGNLSYNMKEELCADHGFTTPGFDDPDPDALHVTFAELDRAWASEIIERRNAA